MPRDKTVSHVKIMAAARKEFMEYPLEEALRALELIEAFFLPGWKVLLGF